MIFSLFKLSGLNLFCLTRQSIKLSRWSKLFCHQLASWVLAHILHDLPTFSSLLDEGHKPSWKFLSGYFQINVTQSFAFCSGTLDWIVLILVWFKRSLYSAQVSRQSCPLALKLMISQAVEGHGSARVVTCGSGTIPLCWHDTLWPSLRIARFLPACWPIQWSSVEVTSKYRPTHLPWWQLTLHTVIIQHAYCPGSCGFLQ